MATRTGQGFDMEVPGQLVSPACIPTDNLISVAAVRPLGDPNNGGPDTKPNFSNFGKYRVELAAPGGDDRDSQGNPSPYGILGLRQNFNHNPPWSRFSGTSQAAPHVTGAIQLVKSKYPWEDYAGLRDRVIMGTDDIAALDPNGTTPVRTGGRLNLAKALQKRTLIGNASARAKVEHGDRIIIGGFVVGPPGPCGGVSEPPCLTVAIRGRGPSLSAFGVPNVLPDPKLQLNSQSGFPITANDDWGNLPQADKDQLAAAGLTPTNTREAAIVRTLSPGTYTVFLESQDVHEGIGLLEIYELSGGTNERVRLRNLSVRCPVGVGDERAIAGTNLTNSLGPTGPKRRLLMRAAGPSLEKFGVPDVLADPKIELLNSSNAVLDSNDQWREFDGSGTSNGLEKKLEESEINPIDDLESALWPTLVQGAYTAILEGVGNGTGIGLIDFLEY